MSALGARPGVRGKLVLLSLLILVIVSFGFTMLELALSRAIVEDDLRERAIAFSQEIAATIGDRRELESGPLLHRQIARILEVRRNVLQLDILAFAARGTTVVASSEPSRRLPFTSADVRKVAAAQVVSRLISDGSGRHWEVMAPITLDGAVAGAVAAKFSLDRAHVLTSRVRWWALGLTAVSVALAAVLMRAAVAAVVSRPLGRFMDAIARVKDGDTAAVVRVDSRDEFHRLAEHFNEMMTRIHRFNDELRTQVSDATAELDRRYRELHRLNDQLFRLQQDLRHAERLTLAGRLMAEVAHEVGTPLHSIAGHVELLQAELPADARSPDVDRRLGIIESQVHRVGDIIARLLDLTRRSPGAPAPIDLNGLVRETLAVMEPAFATAGIAIETAFAPALPPLTGHPGELQQVVVNLLTNAMDATPPGGRVRVATSTAGERGDAVLEVSDTGRGIAAAHRKLIFEPFFSTGDHRSGLGLFISANVVERHHGRIDVESEEGRGSTFRVELPAAGAS